MSRLLRADALRMRRSKEFWLCLTAACVMIILVVFFTWQDKKILQASGEEDVLTLDRVLFQFTVMNGLVCAVLVSLFVGSDYSDGTIRNKLIIGHSRGSVYFSNLAVAVGAGLFVFAAAEILTVLLGSLLIGGLQADLPQVAAMMACSLLITVASSSLYVMLAALMPNRAYAAVLCILLWLVMLFAGSWLSAQLAEPEVSQSLVALTADGKPILSEPMPNPLYIGGIRRIVYELIYDLLPTGQAAQLSNFECERMARFPALSVCVTVLASAVGCLGFSRKDLK